MGKKNTSSSFVDLVIQKSMFHKVWPSRLGSTTSSTLSPALRFVRRTFEGVGVYRERLERAIKLPTFSASVVERVVQYLFEDFVLNQCKHHFILCLTLSSIL